MINPALLTRAQQYAQLSKIALDLETIGIYYLDPQLDKIRFPEL
jgi:hypothetical protein